MGKRVCGGRFGDFGGWPGIRAENFQCAEVREARAEAIFRPSAAGKASAAGDKVSSEPDLVRSAVREVSSAVREACSAAEDARTTAEDGSVTTEDLKLTVPDDKNRAEDTKLTAEIVFPTAEDGLYCAEMTRTAAASGWSAVFKAKRSSRIEVSPISS